MAEATQAEPVPGAAFRAEAEPLNALLAFWTGLRRELGRLPARRDLAPERMIGFLPFVTLIDVLEQPRRFKFRLVGTGVVGHTGREVTARFADAELFADRADEVIRYFEMCVRQARPAYARGRYLALPTGREVAFEALLTPLCNRLDKPAAVDEADMMLGGLVGQRLSYGETMGKFDYDEIRLLDVS